MERPIYGPRGEVARRVAMQTGRTVSTVYDDRDSGQTIVQRWSDAEPAMEIAKLIRETGPNSETGAMRHYGAMPMDDFMALQDRAKQIVAQGAGKRGDFKDVFNKLVRQYFQERPAFKT